MNALEVNAQVRLELVQHLLDEENVIDARGAVAAVRERGVRGAAAVQLAALLRTRTFQIV